MTRKQKGRSMIEMLGVLAIIGVLSIGGMSMYRKAILNYRLGQAQHWFETVRFIIAEACANGNQNGCFDHQNEASYKKRAEYVCSQGGIAICPRKNFSIKDSVHTPLNESLCLLHMYGNLDLINIYLRDLSKRTCQAVIDYDWNGLRTIQNYATGTRETVQSNHKHLTQEQKEHLKAECPFSEYIILRFDLTS